MRYFSAILLVFVSLVAKAGAPTDVDVDAANKLGIVLKPMDFYGGCVDTIISVPNVHPDYPELTEANVAFNINHNKKVIFYAYLSVQKDVVDGIEVQQAGVCIPKYIEGEYTISLSYNQNWDEVCKGKNECNISTTCYPNWRVVGVEKFIKKLIKNK